MELMNDTRQVVLRNAHKTRLAIITIGVVGIADKVIAARCCVHLHFVGTLYKVLKSNTCTRMKCFKYELFASFAFIAREY